MPSIMRIIKSGHVPLKEWGEGTRIDYWKEAEKKRPLGRPGRGWIDKIKMDLIEILLGVVDWIGLARNRYKGRALVNAVMNILIPYNAWKLPRGWPVCGPSSIVHLDRISKNYETLVQQERVT
jgi:hypothetical protein